ncbi:unnamed protein product [Mytilus coruscus]|uniref:Uncharacterized protein n=1 Tax=Mytilus coruscus TaxID=42192 RepID=A0A6J8AHR8_MYTCO|nr:unnamed protein product [Mytilus coruscus]
MTASMNHILEVVIFYVDPSSLGIDSNRFIGGKERKRVQITPVEIKVFSTFCKVLKDQAGFSDEAMKRGIGKDIDLKISRIEKSKDGVKTFAITTQASWEIELAEIVQGSNLQSNVRPLLTLTKDQENEMREWAMDFIKCVRQRSIRQQTTMYNTGTLSLNMYNNRPKNTTRVAFQQTDVEMQEVVTSDSVDEHGQFDQVSEYDSDSDEEMGLVLDTPACFDFMQGVVSRSGRTIKICSKYS